LASTVREEKKNQTMDPAKVSCPNIPMRVVQKMAQGKVVLGQYIFGTRPSGNFAVENRDLFYMGLVVR
jgi:hypothetical protein